MCSDTERRLKTTGIPAVRDRFEWQEQGFSNGDAGRRRRLMESEE
jgi:hypothetical protein